MDLSLPSLFFGSLAAVTILAFALHRIFRHERKGALRTLATERAMQYSQHDLFALANRVGSAFPVPGAADLRIFDLIYATRAGRHLYVFTAQYTRGVSQHQWREEMVLGFCEPAAADGPPATPLTPAREGLTVLESYRDLLQHWCDQT